MVLVAKTKPRISRSHKKRTGQHHRLTKHYAKAYHPYIPIVIVVALGLLLNVFWGHTGPKVLGTDTSAWNQSLLQNTNRQRESDNESDLTTNNLLSAAAQAKADDMVANNYWSHNTPEGKTPWAFMSDAGYRFQAAGENLAYGFNSGSQTVTGWMSSPGHRANILNSAYTQVGFGVAHSKDYMGNGPADVIVAMYGEPAGSAASDANQLNGVLSDSVTVNAPPASLSVARVSLLTAGNIDGFIFVMAAIVACGLLWMITRHALAWQRVMVRSEDFVLKHRLFDVVIVGLTMLTFILTRSAGIIA